jgi:hypothetical protein
MEKEYKFVYVRLSGTWQPWEKDGRKYDGGFTLDWAAENIGFGQLTFYNRPDETECYTECMSGAFVKAALDHFFTEMKLTDK